MPCQRTFPLWKANQLRWLLVWAALSIQVEELPPPTERHFLLSWLEGRTILFEFDTHSCHWVTPSCAECCCTTAHVVTKQNKTRIFAISEASRGPALVAVWANHRLRCMRARVRSPYGLRPRASPAGERPISTHACYRIIPGQAQRGHLCPL